MYIIFLRTCSPFFSFINHHTKRATRIIISYRLFYTRAALRSIVYTFWHEGGLYTEAYTRVYTHIIVIHRVRGGFATIIPLRILLIPSYTQTLFRLVYSTFSLPHPRIERYYTMYLPSKWRCSLIECFVANVIRSLPPFIHIIKRYIWIFIYNKCNFFYLLFLFFFFISLTFSFSIYLY